MSTTFLDEARPRLQAAGFEAREHVSYEGQHFELVAIRKRIEGSKLGAAHAFFLFTMFPAIDAEGLRKFSSSCFSYVESVHRSGMPRGLGRMVACFPVAMVPSVDTATIKFVEGRAPGKQWAAMIMPVVVQTGTRQVHYLKRTPLWGAACYRGLRKMIQEFLSPGK